MKKKAKERMISVISVLIIITVWFLATNLNWVSSVFVPSPQRVINVFIVILTDGYQGVSFFTHLFSSLRRLFIAFIIASVVGVPLGLLSGYNGKVRAFVEPIIGFCRPLPPLAYYTLLILWIGIGDTSKITLLFIAAFAPMYLACVSAVLSVKKSYIDSALMLGASKWQVLIKVLFPACLPGILTGIRTGVGAAYTTLVAAEMVAAISGIGWMTIDASRFLRNEIVFLGIIVMGITGILIDGLLKLIEHMLIPWQGKD